MNEPKTQVNFVWVQSALVAVFPGEVGTMDPSTCACYARVGQHSSGNAKYLLLDCQVAVSLVSQSVYGAGYMSNEVRSLYEELVSIGYDNLELIPGRVTPEQFVMFHNIRKREIERIAK